MQISLKDKFTPDTVLLLFIVVVAAVLRFWNFPDMAYMHDELSALSRTSYDNLSDEIKFGVVQLDTHPAGVQLFIYYWTKVVGYNEMMVKFPFIICGLLSIVVAYRVAKFWFNSSVGLVVAAFMAVLQYMVMYSEIARPYIPGVLFSLLMVWYWTNYFFNEESNKTKTLIKYVVASALCAYTHHFALLFAMVVGFSGLFFISKTNWKAYIIAGVSIFVLYIPHIKIFLAQLSKGGLGGSDGWLSRPDAHWLSSYFRYSMHYSYVMMGLCVFLLIVSIAKISGEINKTQKFRIVGLLWFFVVFFTEYFYSVYVNPVIQFSTLIFVFPFVLMFAFSLFGELSDGWKKIVVSLILLVGIYSLVFTRKHFQTFYHQPYQEQVLNTFKILDQVGDEKKVTVELLIPTYFKEHYFKKYGRKFDCVEYNPFDEKANPKAFRDFVNKQTSDYFVLGFPNWEYIQIIKEKYPYMILKEEGFTYSVRCFTKQKPAHEVYDHSIFHQQVELSDEEKKMDANMEYSKPFTTYLSKITVSKYTTINAKAVLYCPDSSCNPTLVSDMHVNGNSINWKGSEYLNYYNEPGKANTVYVSKPLADFNIRQYKNTEIKIYVWNRNKKEVEIKELSVDVVETNPLIYSLYEPIEEPE